MRDSRPSTATAARTCAPPSPAYRTTSDSRTVSDSPTRPAGAATPPRSPAGSCCWANRSWSLTHGSWAYQLELPPTAEGRRRQLRRYGIAEHKAAEAELNHARQLLDLAGRDRRRQIEVGDLVQTTVRAGGTLPDLETVRRRLGSDNPLTGLPTIAEYLPVWLDRLKVDENTKRGYASHVRVHMIPHLGDIVLDKLRPHHIEDIIAAIERRNADIRAEKASPDPAVRKQVASVRPTGPATIARIRATLRKAYNDALRLGVVVGVANPASLVDTPAPRAKPIVWEPERVERWRGTVPGPVMVWTDEQIAAFLDYAAEHAPDLHPLLHFMAYRGPRRGEACGLLDAEVRLSKKQVSIVNQIAVIGHTPRQKRPKSEAGNRDLILDADTVAVLSAYKARRAKWQLAAGPDWPDTGLFFVRPDGRAWHPNSVSQRFRRLIARGGFPSIRLHDPRHGAATLALRAGVDIKVVQDQLGHSTSTLTRDTYTSVLPELHEQAADAVAAQIKSKRRKSA